MQQDILLPFDLPAVARKKVCIAFDGGMLSSNSGVLLLRGVEQRLGIAARLTACLADRRDPGRIDHPLVEMLRLRMFAIAAGYEDTNDCTTLRHDPVFKMAVGHAPESGEPLCSQPTWLVILYCKAHPFVTRRKKRADDDPRNYLWEDWRAGQI